MSVFLILIGPPRNSQCKLQSPQAALDCAQSPNFNSLKFLLWLTDKEHDEGHWRKRARIEEGAENLNRKHWASPKPNQLSSCWFLAWKTVSSPAPLSVMCCWWQTNESKAASLKCTCTGQEKQYTVSVLGKRLKFGAFTRGLGTEMFTGPSVPQCFCSLGGCYHLEVVVASYFTALVMVGCRLSFCSFTVAAFGAQELFTGRAPSFLLSFLHWVLKKHQSMLALATGRKHPVRRLSGALD